MSESESADDALAAAPTLTAVDGASRSSVLVVPVATGAMIGRYVVRRRVGAGGMGEVYEAFDPGLDRTLAIKLVHGRAARDVEQQQMLIDEAQSLARLSHPNVVQVFDAGTHEGRVFVAMELLEGITLQQWLRGEHKPSWQAVVDRFAQIGRGLAAAHAAGIVHGDFKPSNVMITPDGRPRVFDFGLSRPVGSPNTGSGRSPGDSFDGLSTKVRGTPGYMAPEQMRGAELTPATDQFAFCVALYEALWGARPFSGDTYEQLRRNVIAGAANVPRDDVVPAALRRAVLRGLRVDPAARHDSMDALLAVLVRQRGRRRRIVAIAAAAGVVGTLAAVAAWRPAAQQCDGGVARSAGVWNPEREAAIAEALARPGKSYAEDTAKRVTAELDGYVASWTGAHRAACEAATGGDDAALDSTMACLGDALLELDATVGLLGGADDDVTFKAVAMVDALPDPQRCADAEPSQQASDRDPESVRLREQLAVARAAIRAGHYAEAIAMLEPVVAATRGEPVRVLFVDALVSLAEAHDLATHRDISLPMYREAIAAAAAARHNLAEARAWIQLVRVAASSNAFDEADRARKQAELWVARLGDDTELTVQLGLNVGVMLMAKGEYAASIEHFEATLPLTEKLPPTDARRAALYNNLGAAYGSSGQHERSRVYFAEAAAAKAAAVGPDHPDVATCLNNEAVALNRLGEHERAREQFARGLEIRLASLGADHAEVGASYHNLGTVEAALEHREAALALYREALRIRTATIGADHPSTAITRNNLADSLMHLGRAAEARPYIEEAVVHLQRQLGDDHPLVSFALHTQGEVYLAVHEPRAAIAALEQAIRIREANPGDPSDLGRTRFALARALRDTGGDADRARGLAEQARAALQADPAHPERAQEIDRWLAESR